MFKYCNYRNERGRCCLQLDLSDIQLFWSHFNSNFTTYLVFVTEAYHAAYVYVYKKIKVCKAC